MMTADKLKEFSEATLKSKIATDEQKTAAKKAINRVENRAERIKNLPKRPKRKDFASNEEHEQALKEFRSVLDRNALVRECSRVLDDPRASVLRRRNARELLYGKDLEPDEPVKVVASQDPEKPSHSRLSATELAEDRSRAQAFLDSLVNPDIQPVAVPVPISQEHVPPKSTPKPERWCHTHAVSLDVCRCDANETCPLCLSPRSGCFSPCQNAETTPVVFVFNP